jgi:hypothetical protein
MRSIVARDVHTSVFLGTVPNLGQLREQNPMRIERTPMCVFADADASGGA